jgi:hypothetical protein
MAASSFPLPEGRGSHKNLVVGVANDADVSPASVAVHLKNAVDALKAESKVPALAITTSSVFRSNTVSGEWHACGGLCGGEEGAERGVHGQGQERGSR